MIDLLSGGIVNNGLLAYFDAGIKNSYSGSGTTWTDLAKTNDGTLINSPTYVTTNGGGFSFTATSTQYVNISSTSDFVFTNQDVTFECWCRFTDNDGTFYRSLIASSSTSSADAWLALRKSRAGVFNNGAVFFQYYNGATGWLATDTLSGASLPGNFYHFCGVIKKVSTTYNLFLYRNGSSVATTNTGLTSYALSTINPRMQIGGFGWSSADYMQGNIYIARIYNRALSDAEINQNFQIERKRFGV